MSVPYEFKLPDLGEGLTEGEIARWLVAEGDEVGEDDPLVEIQTDKTTVEIPSPAAGTVSRILVGEGEVVPVGTVLVVIGDGSEPTGRGGDGSAAAITAGAGTSAERVPELHRKAASGSEPQSSTGAPRTGPVRATPVVRRIAQELGVDLAAVEATGPQGRVTEDDVRRAAGGDGAEPAALRREGRREPVRGVRRQIVEHLSRSHREVPAVTFVEECDFTGVDLKQLVALVLRATALTLKEFPELNARLEGDEIVYLDRYDLGLAVQTDAGLVVPVIRDCGSEPLSRLGEEAQRLADGARAGTLKPEELRGSTFTVTSAGKLGGLFVTTLVNHPEVGILGVHRIAPRAVVHDGEIVVRQVGNVSVTFDHRVVDGARAAEFTLAVIARLEASRG